MKITRQEYIEALDIVEKYHQQLNENIKKSDTSKPVALKTGDFVEVFELNTNTEKCLTFGKRYEVIRDDEYNFFIIDDNGKEKRYKKHLTSTFKPIIDR